MKNSAEVINAASMQNRCAGIFFCRIKIKPIANQTELRALSVAFTAGKSEIVIKIVLRKLKPALRGFLAINFFKIYQQLLQAFFVGAIIIAANLQAPVNKHEPVAVNDRFFSRVAIAGSRA